MNCPVVAYAPMPATMPNIAIKPLKRSTTEFIVVIKTYLKYLNLRFESGIPNDLIYG